MDETLRNLEQKSAQLRAVGQISAALAAAWELEDMLDVITRITSEVMGVDSCSISQRTRSGWARYSVAGDGPTRKECSPRAYHRADTGGGASSAMQGNPGTRSPGGPVFTPTLSAPLPEPRPSHRLELDRRHAP
jgi:hypothetical protein